MRTFDYVSGGPDYEVNDLLAVLEVSVKEFLKDVSKSKSSGDSKDNGNEWHHGHCAEETQRNGLETDLLCREGTYGYEQDLHILDKSCARFGEFLQLELPDVLIQKILDLSCLSAYLSHYTLK